MSSKRAATIPWMPTRVLRRASAALFLGLMSIVSASAAAPQLRTQAPGYFRMMLGDFEVTALSDGVFEVQTGEVLTHATARSRDLLEGSFHGDAVGTSVNAYLVNTGERLVLIDTGAAMLFGPSLGHLLVNLAASGYRPEQVDTILITHVHPDHVGGLLAEGRIAFPNATVLADRRDADFWLSLSELDQAPASRKPFFEAATATIGAYAKAGKFKAIEGPALLFPGFRAIPAPGHTPGHTVYAVESRGQKLVVWGDLTEIAAIQFAEPTVTMTFDSDGPESVRARMQLYADAAQGRYLVAGSHLSFPGIGHVRAEGQAYSWVPIDYRSVP
jgi:glyoxylase-like metal-dependent hydrolase (beta-lactamase superfamily II)